MASHPGNSWSGQDADAGPPFHGTTVSQAEACHAVLATPAGRGAVATLLVSGVRATEIVDQCWRPSFGKPLAERPHRVPAFGRWSLPSGACEEVVVCRVADERVEVHCHGGPAAAEAILESLRTRGCPAIHWSTLIDEYSVDHVAAEALQALAASRTARTARILLDQHNGAWGRELLHLRELLDAAEVPATQVVARFDTLLSRASVGLHLAVPWRIAVVGRPNAGKSSLVNALAGFERAIVSPQPGTTRDVLHVELALQGWPFELADTAGLRTALDPIEEAGVARAQALQKSVDLLLIVADLNATWTDHEQRLVDEHPQALIVHSKLDLAESTALAQRPAGWPVSVTTGAGLDQLVDAIVRQLVPHAPAAADAVPFLTRHVEWLNAARHAAALGDWLTTRRCCECLLNGSPIHYFQGPRTGYTPN